MPTNKIRVTASTLKYIRSVKIIYQNIKLLAVRSQEFPWHFFSNGNKEGQNLDNATIEQCIRAFHSC